MSDIYWSGRPIKFIPRSEKKKKQGRASSQSLNRPHWACWKLPLFLYSRRTWTQKHYETKIMVEKQSLLCQLFLTSYQMLKVCPWCRVSNNDLCTIFPCLHMLKYFFCVFDLLENYSFHSLHINLQLFFQYIEEQRRYLGCFALTSGQSPHQPN